MNILENNMIHIPYFSIIILNWNAKVYLKMCLDSVLLTDYNKNSYEVLVVDNGSIDGSIELVKKNYPEVKLIKNERNLGFCKGNNIGIQEALGDIIILLNNDTIVDRNWIKKILHEFEDLRVGVVGCRLLFPGTNIIQTFGFHERFLGYWESLGCGEIFDKCNNYAEKVDYVCGAALAIRRDVIQKIGLLDPRFECVEDAELCYRAKKAGYKVVMSHAVVYHFGSISWRKLPNIKLYLLGNKSRHRLIQKYYPSRSLLRYIIEWPIKSLLIESLRFLREETLFHITINYDRNVEGKCKLISALYLFAINVIAFFITIFFAFRDQHS